jgi:hypothetical protein
MNSIKRKSAIAAVMLAIGASAFGAQAADRNGVTIESPQQGFETEGSAASYTVFQGGTTAAPKSSTRESAATEQLEKDLGKGGVANYDPAEHAPVVKRHSLVTLPSPFDRFDLASPGG